MGLNCLLHFWSALGTLSLVWLTKILFAFSSLRRFDFLDKKIFFLFFVCVKRWVRGQWVGNGLGMIWGLIGNVWVEYQVVTWPMALWFVGKRVTMVWMIFSVLVLVSLRVPQTWSVIVLIFPGTLSHPQGIRGAEYGWLWRASCT